MQTKYGNRIWFYTLLVLAVVFSVLLSSCNAQGTVPAPVRAATLEKISTEVSAPVKLEKVSYIGGGDCSADRATGDLYVNPDWYCLTDEGKTAVATPMAIWTEIVRKVREHLTPTVTATNSPTATATGNPTATITGTPSPKATDETPVVTSTNTPEETATANPTDTSTPEPTAVPTKDCPNKNQYKEGTEDCNAGKGNG